MFNIKSISRNIIRRYLFFLCAASFTLFLTFLNKDIGLKTFAIATSSFKQMLSVLPPIMLILGLIDVWIPRETLMKYMGEDSGILGIFIAITIGSIAAGPMYAAFPFTAVLLKKGAKFSNVIIFMSAWCVTKIPTLLFELTYLGYKFTFLRLLINLPGIILMGYLVQTFLSKNDLNRIYENSNKID
jgi:uncharacterized membrane protein YraQ (UPF0718 family)